MFTRRSFFLLAVSLCLVASGCQSLSITRTDHRPGAVQRCPQDVPLTDEVAARSINVSLDRLSSLKTLRSLTNTDICTMPDAALKRSLAKIDKPKADHPGDWAEFRNLQRRSEDGKVKPDGLIKALEHRKNLVRKPAKLAPEPAAPGAADGTGAAGTAAAAAPSAGVSSDQWTALGPGNVGGRIRSILIDPTDSNRVWLGAVSGGIWTSTNAGASWTPCNDFMGNLSVSSLVMDPRDHNIIYAGTGEGFYNGDAVRGAGVFKSTDGGITWNQLASTIPSSNTNSSAYGWFYVNRLAMASDGSAILAATRGYYGNSGAIFRSTDGGTTWTEVNSQVSAWDVRFDPNDPRKAVANVIRYSSNRWYSNIVYSTDGGITWNTGATWASSSARIELAYAKSNSQIVYAVMDNSNGQVLKSTSGGASWVTVSTPQHLGGQGWYNNTLWVDPTNASHVVIGGLDLSRSTDGGVTWSPISSWLNNMYYGYPNVPHADHHVLVSDPNYNGTTNRKLYNANDGGIYRAADITLATQSSGWESLNNGLAITQFYGGAGNAPSGGRIIGGTQDNGTLVQSPVTGQWSLAYGGDGGVSAVDSLDDNYLYGEYTYLQLHRSTNGSSSSDIYSGISDAGNSATANFIAPFVLDPNDNNRMLAGGASLWQSLTVKAGTPAWRSIKSSIGSNISAIAVTPGNSANVWVGHSDGRVFRTSNSLATTPTWTQVGSGKLPGRMVNRILIDRNNPSLVYVSFGGYDVNNLYRTTDGGVNWTNITGNLPSVPIFTIARHPDDPNRLYVGTEVGMFASEDGGATWYTTNEGPANVEISELSWLGNSSTLLAATHGRGMFKTTVLPPDTTPPTVTTTTPLQGANGVGVGSAITAIFSEDVDPATITAATFTVDHGVSGTVSYNPSNWTATFTPTASLAYGTTYTATISTAVKDLAGNPISQAAGWSFTTEAFPAAVRLLSPQITEYQTLQGAYNQASSGNTIQAGNSVFSENLIFASDITVLLQGGYDTFFTSNSGGLTTLTGSIALKNGKVTIDSFRFK